MEPAGGGAPKSTVPNQTSIPDIIELFTKYPFTFLGMSYKESYFFHSSPLTFTVTSKFSILEVPLEEILKLCNLVPFPVY